jgi:lipopolysaccharide transport system ATP-binding protein
MENYLSGGGTLLLCSHSMYHVQKLCRAALWLKDGRMVRYGPAAEVAQAYLAYHEEKSAGARKQIAAPQASAEGFYAIQSLSLDPPGRIAAGGALAVAGEVYSPDGRAPVVLVGLVRADGTPIYGVATDMDGVAPVRIAAQRFAFSLNFPQLPLLPGKYIVRAHALDPEGVRLFDNVEQSFIVEGATRELGLVRIGHGWNRGAPH